MMGNMWRGYGRWGKVAGGVPLSSYYLVFLLVTLRSDLGRNNLTGGRGGFFSSCGGNSGVVMGVALSTCLALGDPERWSKGIWHNGRD